MIRKRPNQPPVCCCGEIGRRKGLKISVATPYGFDSRQQHHKAKRKACRTGMPFAVRRENPICANLSSPMLPCPVWTPRCLRSILSFPPAGCTSICVKTKSRWMEKASALCTPATRQHRACFLPDMLLDKPDGPLFLSARPELCAVYEDSDVLVATSPPDFL